ncbi:hypothetical protein [Salinispira pacifica]
MRGQPDFELSYRRILMFWAPLAVMWVLMGFEQPALAAVAARLPQPALNLAAFGITFAVALVIESPIIQMLAAATALARDRRHYRRLLRFMHLLAAGLTVTHFLVGITPIYHFALSSLMSVPERLIEPSRIAFLIMTPFSAAVGYRRLWQGVLIRCGRTAVIPVTMIIRISATGLCLTVGYLLTLPGATLAAISISAGVIAGAIAAGLYSRGAVASDLEEDSGTSVPGRRELLRFYVPLSLTSVILLASNPALTLGMARSAAPFESLAAWPVINGFMFLFTSMAMSYQEAVIALLERHPESGRRLSRFSVAVGLLLSGLLLISALTPLRTLWFQGVSGLDGELLPYTRTPLFFIAGIPLLLTVKSWLRGVFVRAGDTGVLARGTVLYTVTLLLIVLILPAAARPVGAALAASALLAGHAVENGYLAFRFRRSLVPARILH